LWVSLSVIAAFGSGFWLSNEIAHDSCLDAGGKWDAYRMSGVCIGARE
jgi:hypothetical protein